MEGQNALQMEKSQASGSLEEPCGTQISAGRQRSRPEGLGEAGKGVGHHRGSAGWQEARLLLDWSQGAAVAGDPVDHVPNDVVAADAVTPHAHRVGKLNLRPRSSCEACAVVWW